MEIDPTDYQTKVQAAEADIVATAASRRAALASKAEAEASVEQAKAALTGAQATFDFATRELERYEPLVARGLAPATTLSQLKANRDRAEADVIAQRAAVQQAKSRIATIVAQIDQSIAQADAARAQLT